MTSQYRRGADFERRVRDHILALGAVAVIRSAGSKGLVDLVAWMENGETWMVQVKLTGKISKEDQNNLRDLAEVTGCKAVLAERVGRGAGGIKLTRIEGAVTKGAE